MAAAELGLRALEERRELDALPALVATARGAPNDANLHHILGLLHRAVGDLAPAIAALDQALASSPASPRLVHARARCALEAGLPSLDWFERARRLAPSDGDIILGQAAALLAERQAGAADTLLSKNVTEHPGWLAGHSALIRLRYVSGQESAAYDNLDAAIVGASRDLRLHLLKIMSMHRARLADDAFSALAIARRICGNSSELLSATAMLSTEYDRLHDADIAFAGLDPLANSDLAVHWFRHLLRRQQPERLTIPKDGLSSPIGQLLVPYLSLAWRLLGDTRADWLDDARHVKIVDFGEDWPLLGPVAETVRQLHVTRSQPLDQSVRGGTQTDGPLFARVDPAIRAISKHLESEVAKYIAGLSMIEQHPFLAKKPHYPRYVGSWSVRLSDGGFHDAHVHSEGWLSSAFYLATPQQGDDSAAGSLIIGEPQRSLGIDLPPQFSIEARPGRLVLFPSTSWHGTRPYPAGERLSIAFDIG